MFSQLDDSLPFGDFKGSTPGYKAALASVMGSFHKDAQSYEGKGPVEFL
jgi:hypothetical protein